MWPFPRRSSGDRMAPRATSRNLDRLKPVRLTDDTTITIYRTSDLKAASEPAVHFTSRVQ